MTVQQAKAARAYIEVVRAMADAVRDAGTIPAGTLYAAFMQYGSLEAFERVIGLLVESGVVKRDPSGLLHWQGVKS